MAFIRSLFFFLFLVSFVLLSDRNGVFPSEAMTELERLRAATDAFLNFLGVALGAQEERLWDVRRHVLDTIDSSIRRGTGVAFAMAKVSMEVDLTGVNGFPMGGSCATMRTWWRTTARRGRRWPPMSLPRRCWRGSPSLGFLCFSLLVAY
jgi:hypothetical protein